MKTYPCNLEFIHYDNEEEKSQASTLNRVSSRFSPPLVFAKGSSNTLLYDYPPIVVIMSKRSPRVSDMSLERRRASLETRRNSPTLFPNYRKEPVNEKAGDICRNIHTSVPIFWISSGVRELRVDMIVIEFERLEGHS